MNSTPEHAVVFIDTEFNSLAFMQSVAPGALPFLLSIGIVAQDGREFYGELIPDPQLLAQCSEFVITRVLSQFGKTGSRHTSLFDLGCRVNDFLKTFDEPIHVVHDHSVDWQLLVRLLDLVDPAARSRLVKKNEWRSLRNHKNQIMATKSKSFALCAAQGLQPHHALADARALKFSLGAIDAFDAFGALGMNVSSMVSIGKNEESKEDSGGGH